MVFPFKTFAFTGPCIFGTMESPLYVSYIYKINILGKGGKLGAIMVLRSPLLYKLVSSTSFFHIHSTPVSVRCPILHISAMPQSDLQNNGSEIKEPLPKIPKLQQNGVTEASQNPMPLLKVKKLSDKAVLPSRGTPLSAGYDLSR